MKEKHHEIKKIRQRDACKKKYVRKDVGKKNKGNESARHVREENQRKKDT